MGGNQPHLLRHFTEKIEISLKMKQLHQKPNVKPQNGINPLRHMPQRHIYAVVAREGGTERHMPERQISSFCRFGICRSGQEGVRQNGKKPHFLWELFFCFGELKRCSLPCYYTIGGDLWPFLWSRQLDHFRLLHYRRSDYFCPIFTKLWNSSKLVANVGLLVANVGLG